jgi:hypothetical protein
LCAAARAGEPTSRAFVCARDVQFADTASSPFSSSRVRSVVSSLVRARFEYDFTEEESTFLCGAASALGKEMDGATKKLCADNLSTAVTANTRASASL